VTSPALAPMEEPDGGFRHEAFFYADENEFVSGAAAFLHDGVRATEPALVVVSARKIDLLRKQLKADAGQVIFADMADVGLNPARIIPAWREFVNEYGDRPLRGIGEPIWAERSPAELVECQRHESLLNVAFAGGAEFTLMCPYDTTALDPMVLDEARRSHPILRQEHQAWASDDYRGAETICRPFSSPLPDPPPACVDLVFQSGSLGELRSLVWRHAMRADVGEARAADAVTAVNEVASNSLRHAGGWGVLRLWDDDDALVCEVSDDGHIDEPLVGRVRPAIDTFGGRGMWMVNQLCELVQVRSTPTGTVVRMRIRRQPH
jgi:anti-sigma regulatory factor (Ser/Thr protein kinase)